ncbi:MAG: flagellar hook-length control protein FliK, partial [Deltaproteobacteria bacterium]
EGSVLALRVEQTGLLPILKLVGVRATDTDAVNSALIVSAVKENLWQSILEDIHTYGLSRESVSRFKELIDTLSFRLFSKSTPELLNRLIDKSGIMWEAKVKKAVTDQSISTRHLNELMSGDLKGLASRLLAEKGDEAVSLKRLVSTLENLQILNHLGLNHGRKIFLPIPMQFPGGLFTAGQLLIQLPYERQHEKENKKVGKDVSRITFLLELSILGPLRADLTIHGRSIEGRFLLTNEEAKSRVEGAIHFLIDRLVESGFSVTFLECYLKEPEIVTESLIREIIPDEVGTLNLFA